MNNKIDKNIIIPASPWWEEFYERLVRSIKIQLINVIGKSLVTFEELQFCMSEDDIEEALTLFYLMYGRNILSNNMEANLYLIHQETCRLSKELKDYRKCFSKIYLNKLKQQHNKLNNKKQEN